MTTLDPPKRKIGRPKGAKTKRRRKPGDPPLKQPREQTDRARWTHNLAKRQENSDIGPIPPIKNKRRRLKCKKNFKAFLETYLKSHFGLKWSKHHLLLFKQIQETVFNGGCVTVILPRASGKTTILTMAVLWITLYGHRRFVMFAPGNGDSAPELLDAIKGEMLQNQMLLEDFPEVCYPMVQSEGTALRARYQMSNGTTTGLMCGKYIRYPMLQENVERGNSGVMIRAKGFLGSIRGNVAHLPTGETIRPDFFLIDDPQTSASAWSKTETDKRKNLITKDIMRSAGPGQSPAAFCTATVIQKNDLADQMCTSEEFVMWDVIRVSMLESWPKEKDTLWQEYGQLRRTDLREGRKGENATKFYRKHKKKMDVGGKVYWDARVDPGRASALESAMARWIDDPAVFASEDQNDPLDEIEETTDLIIKHEDVVKCIGEYDRLTVPDAVTKLTAFIDISQKCLWYMVCGFDDQFRAYVVDYGVWPKQPIKHVTLATVKLSLRQQYGGKIEDAISQGLNDLVGVLMGFDWVNSHGESVPLDRGHIDAKWNPVSGLVRSFCWNCAWSNTWFPYEGIGIRASSRDLNDTAKKKERREVRGVHWRAVPERGGLRVIADSNSWKSFTAHRIKEGDVKLPSGSEQVHSMILDQWTAEYPVRVEGRGRVVDEWKKKINHADEHFWDCLYNCYVIGSILGLRTEGQAAHKATKTGRRRRSAAERQQGRSGW